MCVGRWMDVEGGREEGRKKGLEDRWIRGQNHGRSDGWWNVWTGRGGWTGELMLLPLGQAHFFSNVSSCSLSVRASLQDLLGPGRVSDLACLSAQVDMFSYGMVLYELLSGQRPALGQHQLQIAGCPRASARFWNQPEEVQFHRLQALMMECWDTKPEKVPGALAAPAAGGGCGSPEHTCAVACPLFTEGLKQMGSSLLISLRRYMCYSDTPSSFSLCSVTLRKKQKFLFLPNFYVTSPCP